MAAEEENWERRVHLLAISTFENFLENECNDADIYLSSVGTL